MTSERELEYMWYNNLKMGTKNSLYDFIHDYYLYSLMINCFDDLDEDRWLDGLEDCDYEIDDADEYINSLKNRIKKCKSFCRERIEKIVEDIASNELADAFDEFEEEAFIPSTQRNRYETPYSYDGYSFGVNIFSEGWVLHTIFSDYVDGGNMFKEKFLKKMYIKPLIRSNSSLDDCEIETFFDACDGVRGYNI